MAVWNLDVTYDLGGGLSIAGPAVHLRYGDQVVWTFRGIPNDCLPGIEFKLGTPALSRPLGPFTCQRQTANRVIGSGTVADLAGPTAYPYTAVIHRPQGRTPLAKGSGSLTNANTQDHSGNQLAVDVREDKDGLFLEIAPATVQLVHGGTMTWNFRGVAKLAGAPWVPSLFFKGGPAGAINPRLGPFTELCLFDMRPENATERWMKIVGSGNNHVPGSYDYGVEIRLEDTVIGLRSPDPVIDNLGEPTIPTA